MESRRKPIRSYVARSVYLIFTLGEKGCRQYLHVGEGIKGDIFLLEGGGAVHVATWPLFGNCRVKNSACLNSM